MSERDRTRKGFSIWFWVFLAVTVVSVVYYGEITLASAHAFTASIAVRQMSIVYDESKHREETKSLYLELKERLDKIDPYSDD